jgi:hypothetical protein
VLVGHLGEAHRVDVGHALDFGRKPPFGGELAVIERRQDTVELLLGVGVALQIASGDVVFAVEIHRCESVRHAAVERERRPRRRCEHERVAPRQQPCQQKRRKEDYSGFDTLYHRFVVLRVNPDIPA